MNEIFLFIDGSVITKSKIGFGAYLFISDLDAPIEKIKEHVKVKRFENTSSVRLELQNLLWALSQIPLKVEKIIIYTDSQNIIGLKGRRERLEQNNYYSGSGKLLKNHELYKEFYKATDNINCEFIKLQGHKPTNRKTWIDNIFTLVDRASRNASREDY